ncbi:hypothetical protein FA13DRAFT_1610349, partial [Coprinellus micaceus]
LIQEPYRNFADSIATARGFRPVYPSKKARKDRAPRSAMWVNEKISTNTWCELDMGDNPDITAIRLTGDFGQLAIFNVYNDCSNDDS